MLRCQGYGYCMSQIKTKCESERERETEQQSSEHQPLFHRAVQFGLVSYGTQLYTFELSKGYQITVPRCTCCGHPFIGVPSGPKRVPRGWSYTRCSPLTASRQKALFKCYLKLLYCVTSTSFMCFKARMLPCRFQICS